MATMRKRPWADRYEFASAIGYIRGKRIDFAGRPYIPAIYQSTAKRLVIRASRQVEKSTFLALSVIYYALMYPGVRIVCVFPREEQAVVFWHTRLSVLIEQSPVARKTLIGSKKRKMPLRNIGFRNGSWLHLRAAFHNADAVRGLDTDILMIDEFQDVSDGCLPVIEESMSHSDLGHLILTGTPKSVDNHLEAAYSASTANEWRVLCDTCQIWTILNETCLGPTGIICPSCRQPIDPRLGKWIPLNPTSTWGDGYWLNHLAVPWLSFPDLLLRQCSYNPAAFRNECLGLPTALGDLVVTREEVEACCNNLPMATSLNDLHPRMRVRMLAGVDWGGGSVSRTVLVIGHVADDGQLIVRLMKAFPAQQDPRVVVESVAEWCERFQVRVVAADGGGNGTVYNSLLLDQLPRLPRVFAMQYTMTDHPPKPHRGRLWDWKIGRSPAIGWVISQIKKRQMQFPQLAQCTALLREIYCETAKYDPQQRSVQYVHSESEPDDTLHALTYLGVLSNAWYQAAAASGALSPPSIDAEISANLSNGGFPW
jgi:Phage terminase large subunit (GpA)